MPILASARPIDIEPPQEFDPIKLYWAAYEKFTCEDFTLDMEKFSIIFGWDLCTIKNWQYGQKCSKAARIRAAELKEKWNL